MQAELVERASQGDRDAFASIAASIVDRCYALAFRILRDPGRAQDATQQALLGAWRDIATLRDPARFDAWLHRLVVNAPLSRGSVRLRSADPTDAPRIDLPNLREPSDLERLTEGFRRAREIAAEPAIRRLCTEPLPPEIRDHRELLLAVRQGARSVPHVVGTCSMGPSPEDGAVVDGAGRVFGTERLFVVDASIMPTVPSGFTHLPTIMIAERLSGQIAALP